MITLYKNFLADSDAKNLVNEINQMNPEWFSTAYKFKDNDVKYVRNSLGQRHFKKKYDNALVSSMQKGYFTYRFSRSTQHVKGCKCFECTFREKALNGFIKKFVQDKLGYKNAVLGENFISCYEEGDFLSMHADKQKGGCAFVLNLTQNWRAEYGGLLHVKGPDGHYTAVVPEFNSLVIMELGDGGRDHFVSEVSKYAPQARIAISGWYADSKDK